MVLHEGRNRQIRRMGAAVGHDVRRLHRASYAGVSLSGLATGEYRALRPDEWSRLRRRVGLPETP